MYFIIIEKKSDMENTCIGKRLMDNTFNMRQYFWKKKYRWPLQSHFIIILHCFHDIKIEIVRNTVLIFLHIINF